MDSRRPKPDRRTALKLFKEIQTTGFEGDYSRVAEFGRRRREAGGQTLGKAFVPLRFELGEAFQFDWSKERLLVGGVWCKILAAHLKLCASRAFVLQAYPTQSHEMLFDAHIRFFMALGGIPRRRIYDNMCTAVDKVNRGKSRVVNTRFAAMASRYLFDPRAMTGLAQAKYTCQGHIIRSHDGLVQSIPIRRQSQRRVSGKQFEMAVGS